MTSVVNTDADFYIQSFNQDIPQMADPDVSSAELRHERWTELFQDALRYVQREKKTYGHGVAYSGNIFGLLF